MVAQPDPLSALTRVLSLAPGVYRFSVAAGSPTGVARSGELVLPAVYIAPGPDNAAKAIELMAGPAANGTWLSGADDLVFARIADGAARLLMTSIPAAGGEALEIAIDRVDGKAEPAPPRRR